MSLRNGKRYLKLEDQPFKLILLPEKNPFQKNLEKKSLYDVNIDFDEASRKWRKNKI